MKERAVLILLILMLGACTSKTPDIGDKPLITPEGQKPKVGDWESSGADGMREPIADAPIFGGDWESSGGDGVICFADKETLEKSQPFLRSKEYLDSYLKSIRSLESYEYFEGDAPNKIWSEVLTQENEQKVVEKVLNRVRRYAPVFAQKVDLVLESIKLDDWVESNEMLENIKDSTPVVDLPSNCQLIQLAERRTISAEAYLPQVEIHFDKLYYERLSTVEKGMLIFHEALYLIGKESGHMNSDAIRKLNAILFTQGFDDHLNNMYISQDAQKVRALLDSYFGSYIKFFVQEDFYEQEGDYKQIRYKNNFTRNKSFVELNTAMTVEVDNCQMGGRTHIACMDKLMQGDGIKELVNTNEKAFLFMFNYFFESYGVMFGSSEDLYVLDHRNPQEHDESIQFLLGSVCGAYEGYAVRRAGDLSRDETGLLNLNIADLQKIHNSFGDMIWFKDFLVPSLRYCKEIRKKIREEP